ncbi:hypothetical protein R1sor_009860 [Riccia sorocarpa]|uniref:Uncharacterized protein n=1 Tax=Riccia sorocarpa TaxID=122646 RepID=A0ABD3HYA9_9MARC
MFPVGCSSTVAITLASWYLCFHRFHLYTYSETDSVADFFRSIGSSITSALQEACATIWASIKGSLLWIVELIPNAIGCILGFFADIFGSVGHSVGSVLQEAWLTLGAHIKGFLTDIVQPIADIGCTLREAWTTLWTSIKDCQQWILHVPAAIFRVLSHCQQWILHVPAAIFRAISHIAVSAFEKIEVTVESSVNICKENPTCLNLVEEAKYYLELARDNPLQTLLFVAAVIFLVWFSIGYLPAIFVGLPAIFAGIPEIFTGIVVQVVRCCGFAVQGIRAGTSAAWIMARYGGHVTVGSLCALCQSIGATRRLIVR